MPGDSLFLPIALMQRFQAVCSVSFNLYLFYCYSFTGDMSELKFRGMFMNPTTLRWSWTSFNSMNYACSAKKPNY